MQARERSSDGIGIVREPICLRSVGTDPKIGKLSQDIAKNRTLQSVNDEHEPPIKTISHACLTSVNNQAF